ncbi:methyltransferase-like protein 27 [Montipora foliosa]|uniref:methyltransferase-like protein 27 n=1 Tax=Montipora foliosa TaxID=591990 RepID=UPI0035F169B9
MASIQRILGIQELSAESSEDDARRTFDKWAATYEEDSDHHGYKAHALCIEAFNEALKSKDVFPDASKEIRILDAGAGTGIIGEKLVDLGYRNIDALDMSQNMLDLAASKNVYKRLICGYLSKDRIEDIKTGEYDITLCGGTIVYGQAKPEALYECVRHLRPGGLFIFTIRVDSFDPVELGYSTKFEEMEKAGIWSLVKRERRELYSNPHEERHRDCYLITYKVLKNS